MKIQLLDKFCIIINPYLLSRISKLLFSIQEFNLGYDYDICLVHNKFETKVKNTSSRLKNEIDELSVYLYKQTTKNINYSLIERENIGETHGAFRIGYLLNRNLYKYYFFIQEKSRILKGNFLKEYANLFDSNLNIGLICPHIGAGHIYPYAIKSSFFCIKNEINLLGWKEPKTRAEVELQEMEFFYPYIKNLGYDCMQYGSGKEYMAYFDDDGNINAFNPIASTTFIC